MPISLEEKNYYKLLEISIDEINALNDEAEIKRLIKKAYTRLLRLYPPDQKPDEFKVIRQAYDTLSDQESRMQYNKILSMDLSGNKTAIENYLSKAQIAMNDENYKAAISEYKKALILEPNIDFIRNLLGLAFAYDEQYDDAIRQFETIIKDNPENTTYYANLGKVYSENEQYDKAEKVLKRAILLEPSNSFAIITLARVYYNQENVNKGISILRKAIDYDNIIDFEDFIYYIEIIQMLIFSNDAQGADKVIDEVETLIEDEETRSYVAWRFAQLAVDFSKHDAFEIGAWLSLRATEIDPYNEDIKNLHESTAKVAAQLDSVKILLDDDLILGPFKGPVFYYFFADSMSEDEFQKNIDKIIQAINNALVSNPEESLKSIERIMHYYPTLYEVKKEFYDDIKKIANKNIKIEQQYERLKDDYDVVNGFKYLISIWLSIGLSEEERETHYAEAFEQLKQETMNDIQVSINVLKSKYKLLYELNKDYFNDIKKEVDKGLGASSNKYK